MPTALPAPVETIERFAELSALLDDPFSDEDEVLAATGLDRRGWREIEARWRARLGDGDLAARFAASYRATKDRLRGGPGSTLPGTQPGPAGFLTPEAQPWRAEAAKVGRHLGEAPPPLVPAPPADAEPAAETLECAGPLRPALPFHAPPDATLELGVMPPRPALPFFPR